MTTDHASGTLRPDSDPSGATPAVGFPISGSHDPPAIPGKHDPPAIPGKSAAGESGLPGGLGMPAARGPLGEPESSSTPLLVMPAGGDGSADGYASQSFVHSGATTAIEFRVTRPDSPARRLRLSGPRYTFGSGEGCSIRLSDDDLLPLHAVLIRDPERINVRAYSVPIEINGDRVSEGTIRPGDLLTLGSYRFELLSTSASVPIRGAAFQVPSFGAGGPAFGAGGPAFGAGGSGPWGRSSFLDSTLVTADSALASESAGPEVGLRNGSPGRGDGREPVDGDPRWWRERLRREVDLWRARQADCDRRQAECDRRDARCDGRESELRQRESELWGRLEQLRQRESELTTAAFRSEHAERTLTEAHNQLEQLRRENDDRSREFERREEELKQAETECRRRAEAAERELTSARGEADTASEAVEAMRAQFVTLRQQLAELTEQHAALESREQTRREEYEANFETINGELERARQDARAERRRAAECEELAEQLDAQVVELQKAVDEARQESERLRQECELATKSIAELEPLAERGRQADERRTAHETEVRRLSESVDRLTDDLAAANNELGLLRESNQDLVKRLEQTRLELDAAIADADSRPTHDEVRSLREKLESAQEQLAVLRRESDRDPGPRLGEANGSGEKKDWGEENGWGEEDGWGGSGGTDNHGERTTEGAEDGWTGSTDRGDASAWDTGRESDRIDDPGDVTREIVSGRESGEPRSGSLADDEPTDRDAWTSRTEPEDDSIEAYMNRLLQRVQGPSFQVDSAELDSAQIDSAQVDSAQVDSAAGEPVIGPAAAGSTETGASTVSSTRPLSDPGPWARPATTESDGSGDGATAGRVVNDDGTSDGGVSGSPPKPPLVPRSHPPENDNKIEALRDLANESAHSAIARSARIQTRDSQLKGMAKLGGASVAAMSGIAAWWWIDGPVRLLGVTASTVVTGFFLYEAVSLIRDARRRVALLEAGRFEQLINSHTRAGQLTPDAGREALADPRVSGGAAKLDGDADLRRDDKPEADADLKGEDRGGLDIGRDPA